MKLQMFVETTITKIFLEEILIEKIDSQNEISILSL